MADFLASIDWQAFALLAAALTQAGYGLAAYRLSKKHDVKIKEIDHRVTRLEGVPASTVH